MLCCQHHALDVFESQKRRRGKNVIPFKDTNPYFRDSSSNKVENCVCRLFSIVGSIQIFLTWSTLVAFIDNYAFTVLSFTIDLIALSTRFWCVDTKFLTTARTKYWELADKFECFFVRHVWILFFPSPLCLPSNGQIPIDYTFLMENMGTIWIGRPYDLFTGFKLT